jgi:hypothetical protein
MKTNIGEHVVNYEKTEYPREYEFSAIPSQGVSPKIKSSKGWVYADSEDGALEHIRMLISDGTVFEAGQYIVTMTAAKPSGFWYSAEPADGSKLPAVKKTHMWEPRLDRAMAQIKERLGQKIGETT